MKRVGRSRSGREIYGPKWQNLESTSSENEEGDDDALHSPAASTQTTHQTTEPVTQTNGISRRRIRLSNSHGSMYRATLEGDAVAVEMLLEGDPKLASDEISEEGDRALHVAAAIGHKEIVRKLVEEMSPSDLTLLDGNGYTACCYAAISGKIGIAALMIGKNRALATARDRENKTPLYKAAFRGNPETVSYFLKYAKGEDLPTEEWFDLLLVTTRRRMYDVALKILESNEQLATMKNDEGTALHLLAKQRVIFRRKKSNRSMRLLAKKLWEGIQRHGEDSVVELMKNPPILHIAAEVGNVEFITMITHTYPHLVWHTDSNGYTIFHIAVKYRKGILFGMIEDIGARKDLIAVSQDEDGNNILHLAAKLGPRSWKSRLFPSIQLQTETMWLKKVEAIVPPLCSEMKNKEGFTPSELFFKEHKSLLEKNTTWMRNTADSCMLISTLIFSLVFAAAFAIPGGYNQETGIPILFDSNWFTCFVVFEAFAMFFSARSVLTFSRVMMGSEGFSERIAHRIKNAFLFLSLSVFGAVSVFMSAYFLIYVKKRAVLVTFVIIFVYVVIVCLVFLQNVLFSLGLSRRFLFPKRTRHSLFKRHDGTVGEKRRMAQVFGFLKRH